MKRQSSLALCALFLLSACQAPGVISGGEYNPSETTAATAKQTTTSSSSATESNSPVATTYAVQDTPNAKTSKALEVNAPPAQPTPAPSMTMPASAEVTSPGISTALPKEVPQLAQASATPSVPAKIERVPFRLGVSSVTVERMAKQNQCESKTGAGLLARNGPIEVYRVDCDGGKVYMARCEMRQCSPMTNAQDTQ